MAYISKDTITFPVKIGENSRIPIYSATLTNGEEQLLITRDCKFFLTDGAGGYLEFKTINSGITMDEVTKLVDNLNTGLSGDVTTLEAAVVSLGLEFSNYVTKTEFDALALTVGSNTTLATHDNRDVLDLFDVDTSNNPMFNGARITDANSHTHAHYDVIEKFTEDANGDPLYNGAKIAADNSLIEAEIASLNARGVIGSELDCGLFGFSAPLTIAANSAIIWSKTYYNSGLPVSNGIVSLKRGRRYSIKCSLGTNTTGNSTWFQVYDNTHSSFIGKKGLAGTVANTNLNCVAIIDCIEDTNISVRILNTTGTTYTIDVSFAQMTYLEVIEIGRTTIINPCEDGKNIKFEYAEFRMSADQTTNLTAGSLIAFDTLNSGNLTISSNKVLLKSGKKYRINANLLCSASVGFLKYKVYNETDGIVISRYADALSADYSAGVSSQPVIDFIYEATKDIYISVKIESNTNCTKVVSAYSYLIIQEIAQPYYFNYYKDSISSTVLFDGNASAIGDYTLLDDITKYKYLIIDWQSGNSGVSAAITQNKTDFVSVDSIVIGDVSNKRVWLDMLNTSGNCRAELIIFFRTNKILNIADSSSLVWTPTTIKKITGIGYNYDNPYQDVITTMESLTITDAEIDADIIDVWNGVV